MSTVTSTSAGLVLISSWSCYGNTINAGVFNCPTALITGIDVYLLRNSASLNKIGFSLRRITNVLPYAEPTGQNLTSATVGSVAATAWTTVFGWRTVDFDAAVSVPMGAYAVVVTNTVGDATADLIVGAGFVSGSNGVRLTYANIAKSVNNGVGWTGISDVVMGLKIYGQFLWTGRVGHSGSWGF